jgi:hypothetical protein
MRETVWTFKTRRFRVTLSIEYVDGYQYDGDDEGGETQAALDCGEYVAFDSLVRVFCDGVEVGWGSLGGSVYGCNEVATFWTAHRDPDPMNRNCTAMRAARGPHVNIGHYFPSMVSEAVAMARKVIGTMPKMRCD